MDKDSLEVLLGRGLSLEEIGRRFGRNASTVSYWIEKHGLAAVNGDKHAARGAIDQELLADLVEAGLSISELARRKLKEIIVAEAGGSCAICGYSRYVGALEFHHLNPSDKRLTLSWNGVTLSLDTLRAEARKCLLVCSNCHAEIEGGVTKVPDTVGG
jgi:hypothetical protein